MAKNKFLSGEKVPTSGQYKIVGTKAERTCVKGKPFPPTPDKGQRYTLVDKTKLGK